MSLSSVEKQRILATLSMRGALNPCAACGNHEGQILDDLVFSTVLLRPGDAPPARSEDGQPIQKVVPAVVAFCGRCGMQRVHLLGSLGLLDLVRASPVEAEAEEEAPRRAGRIILPPGR